MAKTEQKIPAVVALVGDDVFLQLAALAQLLALLPKGAQRIDYDGETAELADVLDEVRSFAMFGDGKAVVVRNGDDFVKKYRGQLEDYIAAPCDTAMLILRMEGMKATEKVYKLIQKTGKIENCNAPKDVSRWIIDRGKSAYKLNVAPDAARMMADLVGNDLGRLDNELAKLALNCDDGSVLPKHVQQVVAFQREREMFDLTNALAAGNTAAAMARWRQLLQLDRSSEFRAVTWLGIWLENVRKAQPMIKRGESAGAVGAALRIWPPEMQLPFFQTAKSMGSRAASRAIDSLAEIDYQIKTGVGDAAANVERFMLSLFHPS